MPFNHPDGDKHRWFRNMEIEEVDNTSWILGGALISRYDSKPPQPYWEDDQGFYYTMTEAPDPKPITQRVSDSCPITDFTRNYIAEAYLQLSKWHNDRICGVDGGNVAHHWLAREAQGQDSSYNHEVIVKNFEDIGMYCSEFVFAHNHMMPLSFMVDEKQGLLGIFMWDEAGFVPKDWVRTMTRSNAFTESSAVVHHYGWTEGDKDEWCFFIETALIEKGFREFWDKYVRWRAGLLN
ncbi:protein kinase protein [Fusarium langsethiae]|uniref:Protein kinase protein n=1 Tax=Fusarium langsethiae TaxID=179993 RepID=A0A0N0DHR0_FUSLA|nr:protein kinase protein [Fusarium langsethiae]GKU04752.1 unnamed protein product [Fusarium langsethiae]GKU17421.1 unnamed protein product [Fusarium langsethiae]